MKNCGRILTYFFAILTCAMVGALILWIIGEGLFHENENIGIYLAITGLGTGGFLGFLWADKNPKNFWTHLLDELPTAFFDILLRLIFR